jgi:hypothetical protein
MNKHLKCINVQYIYTHTHTHTQRLKRGMTVAIMNTVRSGILEGAYVLNDRLYCIHNRKGRSAFQFYVYIFYISVL